MNIYSSTPFLAAFNKAYFPEVQLHLEDFLLQGQIWRLPTFPDGEPITDWQFIDFFEPIPFSQAKTTTTKTTRKIVPSIPWACHGVVTAQEWFDLNLFVPYTASPSIHWSNFASWEEFLAHVKSHNPKIYRDSQRRKRKLEKEVGPVKFIWNDTRPGAFDFCMKMKATQFANSQDMFTDTTNISFFQELINSGLLVVSSLSIGDKFLAVDLGAVWEDRFYSWIAVYDPEYNTYAPGRLLMHSTMEESYRQGHKEFDLLVGREVYKWYYATHTRLISPMGRSWKSSVNEQFKQHLINFPKTAENLRAAKIMFNYTQQILSQWQSSNVNSFNVWQKNVKALAAQIKQDINTHKQEYEYFLTQKSWSSDSSN
ncbi:MAG: GNAT family N-acetyltransferase [Calothrix sp. MO_167.B42]|nr:GNAT family N-acetyltransferase [Calothrix sp. MO_167.B42]